MSQYKTMSYDLLITDIEESEHKDGFLEICPLGQYRKISLSVHSCKVMFNLFIQWGIVGKHDLELALRRLEYKE